MKLQIDTKDKIVKVQDRVNLKEFINFFKKQFPYTWDKFTLETETFISKGPWIVPTYPYWQNPWWIDGTGTSDPQTEDKSVLTDGVYNVSIS